MYRKLYAKYNKRSRMIETIFLMNNDDEAQYNYSLANLKARETNPYYNEDDYQLQCLGVLEMEGDEAGIIYGFEKDFPVKFDEIADYNKPKYNTPVEQDITVNDKDKIEELKRKSRSM